MPTILDNYGFVAANNNLIVRFDYDGNGNQIYIGWALPGTATSDAGWRILQQNFSGNNMTGTAFPNVNGAPSGAFSFIWDNRASYAYS
jgi:hypothetical protein